MVINSELLLSKSSSRTINLPSSNRTLGYEEYGKSDGEAIICFHGLPGSRIDFARFDEAAKMVGARIISVDRPGFGLSSPDPDATMSSIARDIGVLTDSLGLEKYAILGGSAGGPYALACASILPKEKLRVVALVCSPGKSALSMRMICQCIQWMPSIFIAWYWGRDPGAQVQLSPGDHLKSLRDLANRSVPHEKEIGRFNTEESLRIWLTSSREAFKHGVNAAVHDTYRLAAEWDFQLETIDMPIRLWYGKFDSIAPISQANDYVARLGKNTRLEVLDETHGSMFANQAQRILADIVSCLTGEA